MRAVPTRVHVTLLYIIIFMIAVICMALNNMECKIGLGNNVECKIRLGSNVECKIYRIGKIMFRDTSLGEHVHRCSRGCD